MLRCIGVFVFALCPLLIAGNAPLSAAADAEAINGIDGYFNGEQNLKRSAFSHPVDDRGFVRRLWLDVTGRLPEAEVVAAFLADTRPDKRRVLIEQALGSSAYTDRWTHFFEDLFYSRSISRNAVLRNPFHDQLYAMVAQNQPWDEMARTLIAGEGTASQPGILMWIMEFIDTDFRLDYLDDQVSYLTETMLGVQTTCISCHDGAYHLEDINKGLASMRREQFWGMAALLSQSYFYLPFGGDYEDENSFLPALELRDLDGLSYSRSQGFLLTGDDPNGNAYLGEYRAVSRAGEGMRPPRNGSVTAPAYLFSGETPHGGETRRQALARMFTEDRQFARNMVNRIWAHFMGEGFVEPVASWDLGRIDPLTAQSHASTVQPRDHQLLELLTDYFIDHAFDLKALMRHICNSGLYQSDYAAREQQEGDQGLAYWAGNRRVRRLDAQSIVDSVFQVLDIERKYMILGITDRTFSSTWQLRDSYEPSVGALLDEEGEFVADPTSLGYFNEGEYYFTQYSTMDLLTVLGAPDRVNQTRRDNSNSPQTALALMNGFGVNIWFLEIDFSPYLQSLRDALNGGVAREQVIDQVFLKTLFREPTQAEMALFSEHFNGKTAGEGLQDMLWALFNHPDFLHR